MHGAGNSIGRIGRFGLFGPIGPIRRPNVGNAAETGSKLRAPAVYTGMHMLGEWYTAQAHESCKGILP